MYRIQALRLERRFAQKMDNITQAVILKMPLTHRQTVQKEAAFFKAVSEGVREFEAICVVGGKDGILTDYASPCGVCRQVMMEFCDPETFQIILATGKEQYEVFTLKEILPLGFGPKNLR